MKASSSPIQVLSAGAKAGIGIGAAAVGVAALGLILWYVLRRKAENRNPKAEEMDADEGFRKMKGDLVEAPNHGGRDAAIHEIGYGGGYRPIYELGNGMEAIELVGSPPSEKREKEGTLVKENRAWVDERVAKRYDGAYRGN